VPFTPANLDLARETIAKYPQKKSAILPLLHLAQDQDGWVTPGAMEEIADLLDLTPALVLGTCSFYTMFKREPVGKLLVSVCTNVSCLVNGGPELLDHLQRRYATDSDVTVEEVECIAACDLAPVLQVNYEFHGPIAGTDAETLIDEYKAAKRVARTISGTRVREREVAGGAARRSTSEPLGKS
jgi:NADH-quinone oxidoreductase subunit E